MNIKFPKTQFLLLIFVVITGMAKSQTLANFKLKSTAFEEGKVVPSKYTCDGVDVSPPLSWSGFPVQTKSFALIMDDPDAGEWVHWVVYNIPMTVTSLKEKANLAEVSALPGLNSWDEKVYSGPCPPGGSHHYHFKLYALDKILNLKEGANKTEVLEAMKGNVLAETTLTGIFRN